MFNYSKGVEEKASDLKVCRPDYDVEDERSTQEQDRYARDCEQWLIRELRACL